MRQEEKEERKREERGEGRRQRRGGKRREIKFARREKQMAGVKLEGLLHVGEPEKMDRATVG